MAILNWDENYSVNIKEIDTQHKKLVDLLNKLNSAMKERKTKDVMGSIIKELINYVDYHFSHEEKLLEQNKFPGFEEHKKEHEVFVKEVIDFQQQFEAGKMMLSIKVMNFLNDWTINHILGTDKKYSSFLNSNGIK